MWGLLVQKAYLAQTKNFQKVSNSAVNKTLALSPRLPYSVLLSNFWFHKQVYGLTTYHRNHVYWSSLLQQRLNTWSFELLIWFGVNNNYVIWQTPIVPNILAYRQFFLAPNQLKSFNQKNHSTMLFGFTTGRCGFTRDQKRTPLALETTMRGVLWLIKRLYKFLSFSSIKINFLGRSQNVKRYLKYIKRFGMGNMQVAIHSFNDVTPNPYNGVRQKMRGRKRYRYHKYTYKRFVKMLRSYQPIRTKLSK
jgi:ribosomal protein S11